MYEDSSLNLATGSRAATTKQTMYLPASMTEGVEVIIYMIN